MTYETAASIKGWTALLVAGVGFLCCISVQAPGHTPQERAVAGAILFVGLVIGISWIRSRKRIRRMEQQARVMRKRLYRMRPRTHFDDRKLSSAETLTLDTFPRER